MRMFSIHARHKRKKFIFAREQDKNRTQTLFLFFFVFFIYFIVEQPALLDSGYFCMQTLSFQLLIDNIQKKKIILLSQKVLFYHLMVESGE